MKKILFTILALSIAASSYAASTAFTSGTVYSVGSISASPFKPSPKVTVNYYSDSLTAGTDWAAISYHASSLGNKKGYGYWTSKSDPGMYYFKKETSPYPAAGDFAAPSASTTPTATGWTIEGQ